jgi:hypothetical protein
MRPVTLMRAAILCFVATLVGCQSARLVEVRSDGGVVAIPNNSNTWPFYYRDKAEAMLKQKCPNGYVIDHEEEVVTGTVTHTNSQTETEKSPTLLVGGKSNNGDQDSQSFGALAIPVGENRQHTNETTTSTNVTEWRIYYKAKPATVATATPPAN